MDSESTCAGAGNSTYEEINPMQGVTLGIIATPGIIANTFAIVITAKMIRNQKVVPNVLVLALACCDLFGIIMICWPTWLCYAFKQWTGGDSLCNFQGFMTIFTTFGSGLLATFLALDRYLSIKAPFFHRENISYRSARKVVVAIFIFSAVISVMPVLGFGSYVLNLTGTYCTINWFAEELKDKLFSYFFAAMGFLMIFIVLFCNIHVVILLIKRRNSSKKLTGMRSTFKQVNKPKKTVSEKLQQQYERMMIVISLLFLICWTPFMIRIIGNISGMWCSWSADLQASRLLLLNLVLDPFVYVLARKQYREAFYRHCCCCLPCFRKSRQQSIKIKFAYSASLTDMSDRNRSQTIITQIGDNSSHNKMTARDEMNTDWHDPIKGQSTKVLIHAAPDGKESEKENPEKSNGTTTVKENTVPAEPTTTSKNNKRLSLLLKDKKGILPTISADEIKEALRHLAKESGMYNEGMEDEERAINLFDEVLAALKVCFSADSKSCMNPQGPVLVFDNEQRYSQIEGERRERSDSKPGCGKISQDVYNKALQVMDYISAKRRSKVVEEVMAYKN